MSKNKNFSPLPSFIGGLITGFVIIPVVHEALDIVYTYIQSALIKPSKIVAKGNSELQKMAEENIPEDTNVIGFEYPTDAYEEYDYEDIKKQKKHR